MLDTNDPQYVAHCHCAATWIATLLKKKEHFDQIGKYALHGGAPHLTAIFHASLLVFDNAKASDYYLNYHQNTYEPISSYNRDSRALAVYALRLYDVKYNTSYSQPYAGFMVSRKEENLIDTILKFSHILRGSVNFTTTSELQSGLKFLLDQTVSPNQYGLINYKPIYSSSRDNDESYRKKILAEYKQSCVKGVLRSY